MPDFFSRPAFKPVDDRFLICPIPVRVRYLIGLPGLLASRIASADDACISERPEDAATILNDVADQLADHPLYAGRCRLQAALAMVDAGQPARAWSCVQSGIRLLTSVPAVNCGESTFRLAEWCALSAVAACCGAAETAAYWSLMAMKSSGRHSSQAAILQSGRQSDRTQMLLERGDISAIRGAALLIGSESCVKAYESLSIACRLHYTGGDKAAAVRDLLRMVRCEQLLGRQREAEASANLARMLLQLPAAAGSPVLSHRLLRYFHRAGADPLDECGDAIWN